MSAVGPWLSGLSVTWIGEGPNAMEEEGHEQVRERMVYGAGLDVHSGAAQSGDRARHPYSGACRIGERRH